MEVVFANTHVGMTSLSQRARQVPVACVWKRGKDVSARVSPVVLASGEARDKPSLPAAGHITVAMASCPAAAPEGGHAGVLPFPGGTLCLVARGLSPGHATRWQATLPKGAGALG